MVMSMAEVHVQQSAPPPLRAITVSRDVHAFDLLIEDMEAELEDCWGDLTFTEALTFLRQEEARTLEFLALAVDAADLDQLALIADVVRVAKAVDVKVVLVGEGLDPGSLHEILRAGVDDFAPYPLPEDALSDAIDRMLNDSPMQSDEILRRAEVEPAPARQAVPRKITALPDGRTASGGGDRNGAIFAVQSAAGGNGATTIAVNLAWELATVDKSDAPSVCLIDLGLQFGSVATYLDLPRKPMIFEVLSDIASMDAQAFRQALGQYRDRLSVFTAPADILPLDFVGPDDVKGLLALARASFDIVVVDMPGTITAWTDAVVSSSDLYFLVTELEVRSAQNALRFKSLLQAEGIATDGLSFLLNRGPGKMDMGGRARIEKMAGSLDVTFHAVLPDGGRQVTETNDQAAPLSTLAGRNVLAKEIRKLAQDLHKARRAIEGGEAKGAAAARRPKTFLGMKFG